MREIEQEYPDLVAEAGNKKIRQPGGGRHALTEDDPALEKALMHLVDPATRGDPTSPLLWTSKSTRHLAQEL